MPERTIRAMHVAKRLFRSVPLVCALTFSGHVAAQQAPNQQPKETQHAEPRTNNSPRAQIDKLEAEVKDLHATIADLSAARAQDRASLQQLQRTLNQEQTEISKLDQQISSMMLSLDRVKTKLGIY